MSQAQEKGPNDIQSSPKSPSPRKSPAETPQRLPCVDTRSSRATSRHSLLQLPRVAISSSRHLMRPHVSRSTEPASVKAVSRRLRQSRGKAARQPSRPHQSRSNAEGARIPEPSRVSRGCLQSTRESRRHVSTPGCPRLPTRLHIRQHLSPTRLPPAEAVSHSPVSPVFSAVFPTFCTILALWGPILHYK